MGFLKMSRIKVLPAGLQNQIAAGEVVERPSSVVKELMENSMDAGADNLRVLISQGGQVLVEVVDNGSGMDPADMDLAVTRHATSKISSLEDLISVHSFGFRGEALPSIASVSRLYMASCPQGKNEGHYLEILYGDVLEQGPIAMTPGTKVRVQNLLANIPARLKFLKTKATENRRCTDMFARMSLSHLDADMELTVDERTVYRFFKNETLLDRLTRIWPEQICQGLRDFHLEQSEFKVYGLASAPENAQGRGERMFFYVNQRPVKNKMLISALRQAYRGRLLSREYPQAVLFVQVPPEEVDVNVHPAKSEIRFRNEKHLFSLVVRGVSQAIEGGFFASGDQRKEPDDAHAPQANEHFPEMKRFYPERESKMDLLFHENIFSEPGEQIKDPAAEPGSGSSPYSGLRYLGQVDNSFLLFSMPEGRLMIIDQHAAHERIVFEQISREKSRLQCRRLAMPVQLQLHPAEKKVLEELWVSLKSLGFLLNIFEKNGREFLDVLGLPGFLSSKEGLEALRSIMAEKKKDLEDVLITISCRAAIKAGQSMTPDEAAGLVQKLTRCENKNFCPHGRPVCLEMGARELERFFKRR